MCASGLLSNHPLLSSDILSEDGVWESIQHRPIDTCYCHVSELTASLTSVSSVLFVAPPSPLTDSVGEVVCLVQFEQKALRDVKRGEADSHSDGPLEPVHAQPFVQSTYYSLLQYDCTHGPQNCDVRRAGNSGRLHSPTHHIKRV